MLSKSIFGAVALVVSSFISQAAAQTWTACNPLNRTDCPLDLALGQSHSFVFHNQSSLKYWNITAGEVKTDTGEAIFTVNKKGDAPTMQTEFFIFFGSVSVVMKAAKGQGIISSIVLESDDLDEVDWEFMGGNTTHVETNYFGKGNTTSYDRAQYHPLKNPMENYYNYTVDWTKERINWLINGTLIRTLKYHEAVNGTQYPQTPMNVRVGIWAGGDSENNKYTIEWAGGLTDYTKGPYTQHVLSVDVIDYSNATQYKYGDKTGSWESIQLIQADQVTDKKVEKPDFTIKENKTILEKFNALPQGAKIGIISGISVAGVLALLFLLHLCIKVRRSGEKERIAGDKEFEKGTAELMAYRQDMGHRDEKENIKLQEYPTSPRDAYSQSQNPSFNSTISNQPQQQNGLVTGAVGAIPLVTRQLTGGADRGHSPTSPGHAPVLSRQNTLQQQGFAQSRSQSPAIPGQLNRQNTGGFAGPPPRTQSPAPQRPPQSFADGRNNSFRGGPPPQQFAPQSRQNSFGQVPPQNYGAPSRSNSYGQSNQGYGNQGGYGGQGHYGGDHGGYGGRF